MVTLNTVVVEDSLFNNRSKNTDNAQIVGSDSADIIFGTPGDDNISALGGDDTIIGTTGNDFIAGDDGFDTLDYSNFQEAVTILPAGEFDNGGQTQLFRIENIIGAVGQTNVIDSSSVTGDSTSINVDLGNNSLIVENIPEIGSLSLGVENFVDVIGTSNNDRLTGNNEDNKLKGRRGDDEITGGGGNDTLVGGQGSDRLNGTDSLLRGAGEIDVLRGGAGNDLFILGDSQGAFYTTEGNSDKANIRDFGFGDTIELSSGETYSVEPQDNGFKIFLDEHGNKDLIAKVNFSIPNSSAVSQKSVSSIGSDSNLAFDNQIELPEDSFELNPGESLDIFTGI